MQASSEVLAAPAGNHDIVVAKAIDGKLSAFAADDGRTLWHFQQTEPALILRGASAPQVKQDMLVAGFANGSLVKLTLDGGNLQWQASIAHPEGSFAIQRMIDIDADPIIFGRRILAATYQGHIVSLDAQTGREHWVHDISSYTGMVADSNRVYVADAKSHLWAFDIDNGAVNWRQIELEARNITGPADMGDTIVVGDAEGYLHWFSKTDGHLVARVRVNGSAILATPVVDNHILYVVTTDGHLAAYTIA
jgi:outer membrane protein assembly factor BamB